MFKSLADRQSRSQRYFRYQISEKQPIPRFEKLEPSNVFVWVIHWLSIQLVTAGYKMLHRSFPFCHWSNATVSAPNCFCALWYLQLQNCLKEAKTAPSLQQPLCQGSGADSHQPLVSPIRSNSYPHRQQTINIKKSVNVKYEVRSVKKPFWKATVLTHHRDK